MKEAVHFTEKYLYIRLKNMCHNVCDEWKQQHFDDFIMFEGAGVSVDDVKSLEICGEDFKRNMGDYYMQMINFFPLCPGIFGAIGDSEDRSKNYFACPFSKKYNLQFSHLFWLNQATGLCNCEEFNTKKCFLNMSKHLLTSHINALKSLSTQLVETSRKRLIPAGIQLNIILLGQLTRICKRDLCANCFLLIVIWLKTRGGNIYIQKSGTNQNLNFVVFITRKSLMRRIIPIQMTTDHC